MLNKKYIATKLETNVFVEGGSGLWLFNHVLVIQECIVRLYEHDFYGLKSITIANKSWRVVVIQISDSKKGHRLFLHNSA